MPPVTVSIMDETNASAGVLVGSNWVITAKHVLGQPLSAIQRQVCLNQEPEVKPIDRKVLVLIH